MSFNALTFKFLAIPALHVGSGAGQLWFQEKLSVAAPEHNEQICKSTTKARTT
jgi:hypothetical protein